MHGRAELDQVTTKARVGLGLRCVRERVRWCRKYLGAHLDMPEPTLAGAPPLPRPFTGLGFSGTLIALLASCLFFCTCLDQAGARFGLGLARGFLCLFRLSLAWRPSSREPVPDWTGARFRFGAARGF